MKNFGFVLATKMLVENKYRVRYMYHEKTSNPQDSGWRFFCGYEDDKYVNNPNNVKIYDINTILEMDKSILPYLNCSVGVSLERYNDNSTFILSNGFNVAEECD